MIGILSFIFYHILSKSFFFGILCSKSVVGAGSESVLWGSNRAPVSKNKNTRDIGGRKFYKIKNSLQKY